MTPLGRTPATQCATWERFNAGRSRPFSLATARTAYAHAWYDHSQVRMIANSCSLRRRPLATKVPSVDADGSSRHHATHRVACSARHQGRTSTPSTGPAVPQGLHAVEFRASMTVDSSKVRQGGSVAQLSPAPTRASHHEFNGDPSAAVLPDTPDPPPHSLASEHPRPYRNTAAWFASWHPADASRPAGTAPCTRQFLIVVVMRAHQQQPGSIRAFERHDHA